MRFPQSKFTYPFLFKNNLKEKIFHSDKWHLTKSGKQVYDDDISQSCYQNPRGQYSFIYHQRLVCVNSSLQWFNQTSFCMLLNVILYWYKKYLYVIHIVRGYMNYKRDYTCKNYFKWGYRFEWSKKMYIWGFRVMKEKKYNFTIISKISLKGL